jgi:hypothetical protein
MRIRELFLFTKLARLYFFLYKSCDFIMRMHFVIVQGTSFALAWLGPKCSHPGEHLKISARFFFPIVDSVCYHGS